LADGAHSQQEPRIHALGKTDEGRALHITLTLRDDGQLIRVISARDVPYQSLIKVWLQEKLHVH
jgi:uncharacterized DUF497 family protein